MPRGVEDQRHVESVEEEYGEVQEGKQYLPRVAYRKEEKRQGGKSRVAHLCEGDTVSYILSAHTVATLTGC
jgi:hypothetical protein